MNYIREKEDNISLSFGQHAAFSPHGLPACHAGIVDHSQLSYGAKLTPALSHGKHSTSQ